MPLIKDKFSMIMAQDIAHYYIGHSIMLVKICGACVVQCGCADASRESLEATPN